jgi:hypothetical protein
MIATDDRVIWRPVVNHEPENHVKFDAKFGLDARNDGKTSVIFEIGSTETEWLNQILGVGGKVCLIIGAHPGIQPC